jgi:hypothetical protein
MLNCELLRDSVVRYLETETEVISGKNYCVLSLPIRVLDGAYAEVYVEEIGNESFLVHDGGRTVGHLESSGVAATESRIWALASLAERMGVSLEDGVFKALAKRNNLQDVAFKVGQCCSIGVYDLVKHLPYAEEERIRVKALDEIQHWGTAHNVTFRQNVKAVGSIGRQYTIDFVGDSAGVPVAINLLMPSYGPMVAVDRYAAQVLDLKSTRVGTYKRIAVLAKPSKWKEKQRRIVLNLADAVAEISDPADQLELSPSQGIASALDRLIAA